MEGSSHPGLRLLDPRQGWAGGREGGSRLPTWGPQGTRRVRQGWKSGPPFREQTPNIHVARPQPLATLETPGRPEGKLATGGHLTQVTHSRKMEAGKVTPVRGQGWERSPILPSPEALVARPRHSVQGWRSVTAAGGHRDPGPGFGHEVLPQALGKSYKRPRADGGVGRPPLDSGIWRGLQDADPAGRERVAINFLVSHAGHSAIRALAIQAPWPALGPAVIHSPRCEQVPEPQLRPGYRGTLQGPV